MKSIVIKRNSLLYEATTPEGYTLGYAKRRDESANWHIFISIAAEVGEGFYWEELASIKSNDKSLQDKVIRTILEVM